MITKRTLNCTVTHPETGLTFNVYKVDCFVEQIVADSPPEFVFHERFYETEAGQLARPHNKPKIWIVRTDVNQWFVVEK